jgi:hypothetical protein
VPGAVAVDVVELQALDVILPTTNATRTTIGVERLELQVLEVRTLRTLQF